MIVVDTSALIAILEKEQEHGRFLDILAAADRVVVSAVVYCEAMLVTGSRRGLEGIADLDELLVLAGAEIVAFDADQARAAQSAYSQYGKGNHPTARLNLCDCIAYALAKSKSAPLLYNGNDFSVTDVERTSQTGG